MIAQVCCKLFINVFRWVKSLLVQDILSSYSIRLGFSVPRPCPFGDTFPSGSIVAHRQSVDKFFYLPKAHFHTWLALYSVLVDSTSNPPQSLVSVNDILYAPLNKDSYDSRLKILQRKRPFFTPNMLLQAGIWICLNLSPIGARYLPQESELKVCFQAVLEGLAYLHSKGFVHRDVRWPNILRVSAARWILIDYELVGAINSRVFWQNDILPNAVASGERGFQEVDDLTQVKQLFRNLACPAAWTAFANKLGSSLVTARAALAELCGL